MQAHSQLQSTQPQEVTQSCKSINVGTQQNSQQNINVSQTPGLQSYQPVSAASAGVQNVNTSLHQVQQSVAGSSLVSSGVVSGSIPPQNPPAQQFNTVTLCFFGQDVVQEIVTKVLEIFATLKTLNPPMGTMASGTLSNERRTKLSDLIKVVKNLFKRLRIIYEKCNDDSQLQGMEYMHIESLIPVKEEWDMKTFEERKTSESYRLASEEYQELVDEVIRKNGQLKDVIDQLRRIVWEINAMLMMRKS